VRPCRSRYRRWPGRRPDLTIAKYVYQVFEYRGKLTWITSPKQCADVGVVRNWGRVDLASTHADYDDWLTSVRKLSDNVELGAGPLQRASVVTFFFDPVIDTANVDQNVACIDSRLERKPAICGRIALSTWFSSSVVDRDVQLLQGIQWAV
jgi:hypothetical protein